jgi:hypothetical protein
LERKKNKKAPKKNELLSSAMSESSDTIQGFSDETVVTNTTCSFYLNCKAMLSEE